MYVLCFSVADQAWKLLQGYLDKLRDTENGRCYYRCVASKLLSIGAPLPTWLINDYKVIIMASQFAVYIHTLLDLPLADYNRFFRVYDLL